MSRNITVKAPSVDTEFFVLPENSKLSDPMEIFIKGNETPNIEADIAPSPIENKRYAFPVSKNTLYLVFDAIVRSEALAKVFEDVSQRLTRAYGRSSKHYNLRRCSDEFMLNQQVWRQNNVISDAIEGITSKGSPKFKGSESARHGHVSWPMFKENLVVFGMLKIWNRILPK
ncbi:hypothetical protein JTB14_012423 [Gonioctena quinquepunctata]|nr:hypothetical protein JTB14_012423 [Gonioctena quinquepunctata]